MIFMNNNYLAISECHYVTYHIIKEDVMIFTSARQEIALQLFQIC